jgi:hypothetical protein
MKTNLRILVSLLALCLFTLGARAAVVLQDNFDSYATGNLTNYSGGFWLGHSGASPINVVADASVSSPNALQVTRNLAQDVYATLTNAPYATNGSVTSLYYKFTLRMSSTDLPNATGTYFAHFKDTGTSNFRARTYVTATGAATGYYRVGVGNASGTAVYLATDLAPDTTYIIVVRYVLGTGIATLWVNPATESDPSTTGTDAIGLMSISTMCFRQASGEGTLNVDDLVVGTTFTDVLSGKPVVVQQPQDVSTFVGQSTSFSNGVFGALPLAYRWYYNTNTPLSDSATVFGATSNILVLSNLTVGVSGTYSCMITNVAGTNFTRYALLAVNAIPIPPTITNQPAAGSTNIAGDNVTFSVVAGGVPEPVYQWKVVGGGVTNNVTGANVTGANSDTLTITGVTTNQTGVYFVTLTNILATTNSALATLLVNPPPVLTVASLRALVDPGTLLPTNTTSIYITEGIVTTWTNMTSAASTLFYMQDSTAGIAVFWSGAPSSTNLPPAGARVRVTAPLANFNGLIELSAAYNNPQTSVQILSTNNPLPAAQPLPFDPNVTSVAASMEKLEGTYFVASNVFLAAGTTITGGSTEGITNISARVLTDSMFSLTFTNGAGQSFPMYVNYYTDLPGQPKPSGPVTIYGVLGNYKGTYELIASRYADIISYAHVTNVLSNIKHWGDALTNTFTENMLRPGETLTTFVTIGDAAGGIVTLTPITAGLPASAYWDGITSGMNATAVFHFTPSTGDSSSNYVVSIAATSTSGTALTNTFTVYVPTPQEQLITISEFLANPTTNTNWPNFNPLHRATDTLGISTNDEYIEIANMSGTGLGSGWTLDKGNILAPIFDSNGEGLGIPASSAVVIYGGNITESPVLPVSSSIGSLVLPKTGTGMIVLRNNGYIIDRVIYDAAQLSTNSSLSRFPTINGPFVPQAYISTNATTAGLQYDGGSWGSATKVPTGVGNIVVTVVNNQAVLNFSASTTQASTLWSANSVLEPFQVIFGKQFSTTSGVFSVTNLPATMQFYFITTQ